MDLIIPIVRQLWSMGITPLDERFERAIFDRVINPDVAINRALKVKTAKGHSWVERVLATAEWCWYRIDESRSNYRWVRTNAGESILAFARCSGARTYKEAMYRLRTGERVMAHPDITGLLVDSGEDSLAQKPMPVDQPGYGGVGKAGRIRYEAQAFVGDSLNQ